MKKTFWTTTAALALTAVLSTAANATVTVSLGSGSNFGAFDDSAPTSPPPGPASGMTESVYGLLSWTSTFGGTYDGSDGFALRPVGDSSIYAYAGGGGMTTITFPSSRTSFDFYWGSIDSWNSITINGFTLGGTTAQSQLGIAGDPDSSQTLWVHVASDTAFTSVSFNSSQPAFEFDMATIPESSTWAMMVLGFAGLGYAAFRRTGQSRRPAIA